MGAGICLFERLGNGILCTVNGIYERKTIGKWEWEFNLSNRQAGIVGFKKTICCKMGSGHPLCCPNPIFQEIVFFKSQLKSHNPSLSVAQIEIPFPFFYCFAFMNPIPCAKNPISQPLKKTNPSSHFTPSGPS